jgi:outer membrane protein assembly factor BamB
VVSSPAVAGDGTVLFGSHDGALYAVRPSGELRWKVQTGGRIWASPVVVSDRRGGGIVLVGSDDDQLYAVALRGPAGPGAAAGAGGAPLPAAGSVLGAGEGDGIVLWTFRAGPCATQTGKGPEGARCDVDGGPTVGSDGTVYIGADGLYAIGLADGQLRWKALGPEHCATAPALSPDEQTLYVGCRDDQLHAVAAADGKPLWAYRTGDDVDGAPLVAADGTVYFGSDDHRLYALAPDGSLRWALVTGGELRSAPTFGPAGAGRRLYVASYDGQLYAANVDGTAAWSVRAGARLGSGVRVLADGAILFGSQDDRLYAVERSGTVRWWVDLAEDVDTVPAVTTEGIVYVGTDGGAVVALAK